MLRWRLAWADIARATFFGAALFGSALVAGAWNIPCIVTTGSPQDSLQIDFTETLTQNVANVSGIGWVNEIDIHETGIGGTYLNGSATIPSTTGINLIEGTFTPIGGVLYLAGQPASRYLKTRRTVWGIPQTIRRISVALPTRHIAKSTSTRSARRRIWPPRGRKRGPATVGMQPLR